jgi:hypothetical protein
MNPLAPSPVYKQFEMLRNSTSRRIPRAVRQQSELSVWEDYVGDALVVEMTTHVLADKVLDEKVPFTVWVHVEEWASWWQHTKGIHFPTFSRWLRRPPRRITRRVSRTVEIVVREYVTFPDADVYPIPPRNLGKPVVVQMAHVEGAEST